MISRAGRIIAALTWPVERWLSASNSRRESSSSSKNSMRSALERPTGYTSTMPPREAHWPTPSTMLTRS